MFGQRTIRWTPSKGPGNNLMHSISGTIPLNLKKDNFSISLLWEHVKPAATPPQNAIFFQNKKISSNFIKILKFFLNNQLFFIHAISYNS